MPELPWRVNLKTNFIASTKNIFGDNIENYFGVEDGVKNTHFINHASGERFEVDNEKLLKDPQYFTEIGMSLSSPV